jgi:creatinine amidohydrolase
MFPSDLAWNDFEKYSETNRPVLVPLGSIEAHGPHLPLNTDTIIAYEIAKRVAQQEKLIVYPPLSYSITSLNRPGNILISDSTLKAFIQGIVESLVKSGVKKFIFILGHGGTDMKKAIERAFTDLIMKYPFLSISAIHIAQIIGEVSDIDIIKNKHAGEWETSLLMVLKPKAVKIGRLKEYRYLKQAGIHGDPTKASKKTGNKLVENIIYWIIRWIRNKERKAGLFYNWKDHGISSPAFV